MLIGLHTLRSYAFAAPHAEPSAESRFTALGSINRLHERLTLALLTAIRMTRVGAPKRFLSCLALFMGRANGMIRTCVNNEPRNPLNARFTLFWIAGEDVLLWPLGYVRQNRPVAACVSAVTDSA